MGIPSGGAAATGAAVGGPLAIAAIASSSIFSAIEAKKQGDVAESIGRYNARVAEIQGKEAMARRRLEAKRLRKDFKKQQSRNIAAGAPLNILEENATNAVIDELIVLREGQLEQQRFGRQAEFERFKGRSRRAGSRISAGATLIEGGARIGSRLTT